ncbi:hypothetical protein KNE206_54710 [Kitasatospora sp. NE20-6]
MGSERGRDGLVGGFSLDHVEAAAAEALGADAAALFGPFVALLGQDGADQADGRAAVGEDPDDVGAATDLLVQPLLRVVRPDRLPDRSGEGGEGEQVLADLPGQRVDPHERVRALVEGTVTELGDPLVQVFGHLGHLGLRELGDAQALGELLHPPGRDAEQVTGGDDADEGLLGPAAALQQPAVEVRAGADPRDCQVDRASAGGTPGRRLGECPSPDDGIRWGS